MHFDPTINLSDLIKSTILFVLVVLAWNNLRWRINNLEVWRKEHMVYSVAQDAAVKSIDKLVNRLDTIFGDRRHVFTRSEHPDPYSGEERRARK